MSINDGGSVHPFDEKNSDGTHYHTHIGMSLRDHFAGLAMQGWISSGPKIMGETLDGSDEMAQAVATAAYTMADAMIAAREVKP